MDYKIRADNEAFCVQVEYLLNKEETKLSNLLMRLSAKSCYSFLCMFKDNTEMILDMFTRNTDISKYGLQLDNLETPNNSHISKTLSELEIYLMLMEGCFINSLEYLVKHFDTCQTLIEFYVNYFDFKNFQLAIFGHSIGLDILKPYLNAYERKLIHAFKYIDIYCKYSKNYLNLEKLKNIISLYCPEIYNKIDSAATESVDEIKFFCNFKKNKFYHLIMNRNIEDAMNTLKMNFEENLSNFTHNDKRQAVSYITKISAKLFVVDKNMNEDSAYVTWSRLFKIFRFMQILESKPKINFCFLLFRNMLWNIIKYFIRKKQFSWILCVLGANISALSVFFQEDQDCIFDCYYYLMYLKDFTVSDEFKKLNNVISTSSEYKRYVKNNTVYLKQLHVNDPIRELNNLNALIEKLDISIITAFYEAKLVLILSKLKYLLKNYEYDRISYLIVLTSTHYFMINAYNGNSCLTNIKIASIIELIGQCIYKLDVDYFSAKFYMLETKKLLEFEKAIDINEFYKSVLSALKSNLIDINLSSDIFINCLFSDDFISTINSALDRHFNENLKVPLNHPTTIGSFFINQFLSGDKPTNAILYKIYVMIHYINIDWLLSIASIMLFHLLNIVESSDLEGFCDIVNKLMMNGDTKGKEVITNAISELHTFCQILGKKNKTEIILPRAKKFFSLLKRDVYLRNLEYFGFNAKYIFEIEKDLIGTNIKPDYDAFILYYKAFSKLSIDLQHIDLKEISYNLGFINVEKENKGSEKCKDKVIRNKSSFNLASELNLLHEEFLKLSPFTLRYYDVKVRKLITEIKYITIKDYTDLNCIVMTIVIIHSLLFRVKDKDIENQLLNDLKRIYKAAYINFFTKFHRYRHIHGMDISSIKLLVELIEWINLSSSICDKRMDSECILKKMIYETSKSTSDFTQMIYKLSLFRYLSGCVITKSKESYYLCTYKLFKKFYKNDMDREINIICMNIKDSAEDVSNPFKQKMLLCKATQYTLMGDIIKSKNCLNSIIEAVGIKIEPLVILEYVYINNILYPNVSNIMLFEELVRDHGSQSELLNYRFGIFLEQYGSNDAITIFKIMNAFRRSIEFGDKYLYRAFPKFLKYVEEAYKMCLTENSNISHVNRVIQKFVIDVPVYKFALNYQLFLSKVTIEHQETRTLVCKILAKIFNAYPYQSIWWYVPLEKVNNSDSKKQSIINEINTNITSKAYNYIIESKTFFDYLLLLEQKYSKHQKSPKLKPEYIKYVNQFNQMLEEKRPCILLPLNEQLEPRHPQITDKNTVEIFPRKEELKFIKSLTKELEVFQSKEKPIKITFIDNFGKEHYILFKFEERGDVRKEHRIIKFADYFNCILSKYNKTKNKQLKLRTYSIISLTQSMNLVEMIPNVQTLKSVVKFKYSAEYVDLNNKKIYDKYFDTYMPEIDNLKLNMINLSDNETTYFHLLVKYTKSLAVCSFFSFLVRLGDRHLDNMLYDENNAELMHIDFDCIFEKGKYLNVAEIVDFRFTPSLLRALGLFNCWGTFKYYFKIIAECCLHNLDNIMGFLEVFNTDPIIEITRGDVYKNYHIVKINLENLFKGNFDKNVDILLKRNQSVAVMKEMFHGWMPII